MSLPFTRAEFFEVFARYNEAVWPAQVGLYALALAALGPIVLRHPRAGRPVAAALALLWAWMALGYHWLHFRPINPAATVFAAAFALGAAAFLWDGVVRGRLRFGAASPGRRAAGYALIAYALALYPLLALLLGHAYPAMPTFGLPCPTTIFTIGVLAFLEPPYPRRVFFVPVLWTLVGVQAAFLLGVYEDLALLPAGAAGLRLALHRRRTHEQPLVP